MGLSVLLRWAILSPRLTTKQPCNTRIEPTERKDSEIPSVRINTMKLSVRSLESKETLKIEVPDPCSLLQLKDTISRAISSSSSSSSSVHLSLNRKDEIHALSPHESLHSIGIAGGDLVFYTLNPNAFSRETLPHKPTPQEENPSHHGHTIQDSPEINVSDSPSIPTAEKSPTLDTAEAEITEMVDGSDEAVVETASNTEPFFVKRVLKEALGNDVSDFKLLVLAAHAVILESGFVRVDQVSGMAISCTHLLDEWPSSMISLRYTLPEILTKGSSHAVNLKIQTLGHIVNFCGSLSDDVCSRVHRVYLDKCKFARPLELMLANSESKASVNDDGDDHCGNESEVFELWKMVKDRLALPLLIDLCEKAGLDLPPCFMRLPMELKLMILEYLPGDNLAKVCCTCSELRYLASNDELWKKKFEEEFGQGASKGNFFKDLFARSWVTKKKSEQPPLRFVRPPIWGGEFDLLPGFVQTRPAIAYTTKPGSVQALPAIAYTTKPVFAQTLPLYATKADFPSPM